ncbi:MAG TPA: hypothetical protein VNO32_59770, partial [Candidatus Acidoferrum sp.]|nr:hypothetical protein [Candidatus Acidoferrum sp.]
IRFYDEVEREDRTDSKRSYRVQKSIKNATWCAFIAAAVYGAFAILQWWDFNRSIGLSQVIARQARVQSIAAVKAANAARSAADTAAESLKADQRAWMKIVYDPTPRISVPHEDVAESLTYVNTGRTPANNIRGIVIVDVFDIGDPPIFDYSPGRGRVALSVGMLFPNEPRTASIVATAGKKHGNRAADLSPEDTIKIRDKTAYVALYGQITYFDVFGHEHFVHFCSARPQATGDKVGSDGRAACAKYNRIDGDIE